MPCISFTTLFFTLIFLTGWAIFHYLSSIEVEECRQRRECVCILSIHSIYSAKRGKRITWDSIVHRHEDCPVLCPKKKERIRADKRSFRMWEEEDAILTSIQCPFCLPYTLTLCSFNSWSEQTIRDTNTELSDTKGSVQMWCENEENLRIERHESTYTRVKKKEVNLKKEDWIRDWTDMSLFCVASQKEEEEQHKNVLLILKRDLRHFPSWKEW